MILTWPKRHLLQLFEFGLWKYAVGGILFDLLTVVIVTYSEQLGYCAGNCVLQGLEYWVIFVKN